MPERREAACKTPIFTFKKAPSLKPLLRLLNWTGSVFPLLTKRAPSGNAQVFWPLGSLEKVLFQNWFFMALALGGPLNRLNAILPLLHPLNRYRTLSAIGSAIGRPYLALCRIQTQAGALNRLVLNHLGNPTARLWCYSVKNRLKQARNKNAIGAAILNRILDRDRTLESRRPLSLYGLEVGGFYAICSVWMPYFPSSFPHL